jgi:nitroreductase
MDALDVLQQRVSVPRLGGDVPSKDVLQNIFKAALRVPDHAQLRPWRFLLISGDSREKLGDLFVRAQLEDAPELSSTAIEKARSKTLRAPLIIAIVAKTQTHPKVPEIEQLLSAGASVQNMLLAAHAQGIGAMWRTGGMAYHSTVLAGLGLISREKLIGFLYIGEIMGRTRIAPDLEVDEYFESWP